MRNALGIITIGLVIFLSTSVLAINVKSDSDLPGRRTSLDELNNAGGKHDGPQQGNKQVNKRLATGPIDDIARNQEVEYQVYQGVMGRPGVDFPAFTAIPITRFNCRGAVGGYYADLETNCQVFHICDGGRKISFLCPNGTIFKQQDLICDWWFKVDCHANSQPDYENSHSIPIISLPENPIVVPEHPDPIDYKIDIDHNSAPSPSASRNHQYRKSNRNSPNRGKIHYQSENAQKFPNSRQYSSFEYSSEYENDDTSTESKKGTRHSTSVSLPHYTDSTNYRSSVTTQLVNEKVVDRKSSGENQKTNNGYIEGNQRNFYHYYNADGSNSSSTLELINYTINPSTKTPFTTQFTTPSSADRNRSKSAKKPRKYDDVSTTDQSKVAEHALGMIKTLQQLEADQEGPDRFLGSRRVGLDIPPSASPQTIRTLAEYFATAPDNFVTKAPFNTQTARTEQSQTSKTTKTEIPTSPITQTSAFTSTEFTTLQPIVESAHLSKGTLDKYTELFLEKPKNASDVKNSDLSIESLKLNDGNNDLEMQQSSGPLNYATGSAQIRELAQVFTHALSAYLQDPETFRRVLAEIRPTEPPSLFSNEVVDQTTPISVFSSTTDLPISTSTKGNEEEILDFSDVSKSTTRKTSSEESTTQIPQTTEIFDNKDGKDNSVGGTKTPGSNIIADVLEKSASLYYDRQGRKLTTESAPTLATIIVSDSWLSDNETDSTDYFPQNRTEARNISSPYGLGVRHQNSTPISIAYPTSLADIQAIPLHWGQDLATVKTPDDNLDLIIPAVDLVPPQDKNALSISEPSGEFLPPGLEQTNNFSERQGKSEKDEQLQRSQSQSFVPRGNVLDVESATKQSYVVNSSTTQNAADSTTQSIPTSTNFNNADNPSSTTVPDRYVSAVSESLWTTSATVGELWKSTIFLDPLTINQGLVEEDKTVTPSPHTYLPRSTTFSSVTKPINSQTTEPITFTSTSSPDLTTEFTKHTGFDRRTSKFPAIWDDSIHTTLQPRIVPIYDRRTSTLSTEQPPSSTISPETSATTLDSRDFTSSTTRSPFTYIPTVPTVPSTQTTDANTRTTENPTTFQPELTTYISDDVANRRGKSLASAEVMEKRAKEMFGGLNASTADTLMNVIRHADSNTTVRRLILLLVQTCDEDIDKTVEQSRAALLDALISMPVDDQNLDAYKIANQNKTSLETLEPQESVGYRPRSGKSINFIADVNSIAENRQSSTTSTTTLAPETTPYLTTTTTTELPETTPTESITEHPVVPSITTYRSKSHRKFIVHAIDGSTINSNENNGENGKHDNSDSRALELLRSLYSLAAKWG